MGGEVSRRLNVSTSGLRQKAQPEQRASPFGPQWCLAARIEIRTRARQQAEATGEGSDPEVLTVTPVLARKNRVRIRASTVLRRTCGTERAILASTIMAVPFGKGRVAPAALTATGCLAFKRLHMPAHVACLAGAQVAMLRHPIAAPLHAICAIVRVGRPIERADRAVGHDA